MQCTLGAADLWLLYHFLVALHCVSIHARSLVISIPFQTDALVSLPVQCHVAHSLIAFIVCVYYIYTYSVTTITSVTYVPLHSLHTASHFKLLELHASTVGWWDTSALLDRRKAC